MTDVHNKTVRSFNMSQIKGKDTKPEIFVRKFLFFKGLRFRLHYIHLPGKPDIVLPKYKTIIFIHGCFFHGHENCKKFHFPDDNNEFWFKKITENKIRDEIVESSLRQMGWRVIKIWTCEFSNKNINRLLEIVDEIKEYK